MANDRTQDLNELLSAYLDGELDEPTTAGVVAYLERDAGAALLLRELRETRSLLQDLPRESAPADFAEGVVAAVERQALLGEVGDESPAVSARRRFGPIRSAAAIVLLIGAAGSWIYWQIDRVKIAQMPAERSATDAKSLAGGDSPPNGFDDSLASAGATAGEAESNPGRAGVGDSSPEVEVAIDDLSAASSSGVEEITIKAPAGGSFAATLAEKAKLIDHFYGGGKEEGEGEDQVVMLGTEWSDIGAGNAGSAAREFGLSRRLRLTPSSPPMAASFAQQLEQGRSSETLAKFKFDGESNSLVLDFDDREQREQFDRGVKEYLISNSFLNAAEPLGRSQVADPENQNVYLPGNSGINHTEPDTTQMLLRAPVEVLEGLLDEYTETVKFPIAAESVELQIGDLRVAGVEDTRSTMKAMAVPQLREKMLVDNQPRAEFSRKNAEPPQVGRTVEEWKAYYDLIGENDEVLFGEHWAQARQPLASEFKKEATAEKGLQYSSASPSEQRSAGDGAEASVLVEGLEGDAARRSAELDSEMQDGDSEDAEAAKKQRRARPARRSRGDGPVDGEDQMRPVLGLTSESVDKAGADLGKRDRKLSLKDGQAKAFGVGRRSGNLTFILKMRVLAPEFEFVGPPAPPSLKSKASTLDEPQSKG